MASNPQQVGEKAQSAVHRTRRVERLVHGRDTQDGAGVKLTRILTQDLQRRLDPFLMLDAFRSDDPNDWIGGFPDHPHRGFETVTYMISGRMRHKDSAGHEGLLEPGGMQWMVAGRGVIHSEMPEQADGLMEGFQLWLNLPADAKMSEPWYQDLQAAAIPEAVTPDGVTVRVLAGQWAGIAGAVQRPVTQPVFLDVHQPVGTTTEVPLTAECHAFLVVYRGRVEVAGMEVPAGTMGLLETADDADGVTVQALEDARWLLIAGMPLGEPIVQYGPFVMNTAAQIHQAFDDFRAGRMG